MRGGFRRVLGALASVAAFAGLGPQAQSSQSTVQEQSVPVAPAFQGATDEPLPIVKRAGREHAARVAFTRHYRHGDSPIWIGRPRSTYGAKYRWNRP